MTTARLLVVDDDAASAEAVAEALRAEGYAVETATAGPEALERAGRLDFDVVVSDIRMPGLDGLGLLRALRGRQPEPSVVLMTAFGGVEAALEAIKEGAYDFVSKPLRLDELLLTVRRALTHRRLLRENQEFRHTLEERYRIANIVGTGPRMIEVFKLVARVAGSRSTVLITGESGTGKEVVARALHFNGPRAAGPFVTIDCGGLAESLLESELFGHVRGAFTGATGARRGLFEAGQGGTVFLDEIGDVGPNVQARLLRVLELQEIRPVGGNQPLPIDVRLIAATNRDLQAEVRAGRFREDLFYRLNVVSIHLPPLRERREDVPALAYHFLRKYAAANAKTVDGFAAETMALLEGFDWPGNVRELENAVERAVAVCGHSILLPEDLPAHLLRPSSGGQPPPEAEGLLPLEEVTRRHVSRVLVAAGGNKKRAAAILGVDRRTLYRMLARYGLAAEEAAAGSDPDRDA